VTPRLAIVFASALLVLAASAAAATDPGKEQVHLVAADQAAARAAVLLRTDLGAGWTGGQKKPSLSSTPDCPGWHPKQSDLVLTGAAEADFTHAGLEVDSNAQVLRTARMVRLDWGRTAVAPQVMRCMRTELQKQTPSGAKVVSVKRIAFPRVSTYTAAYRLTIDVTSGTTTVPVWSDVILFGRGRTELELTVIAPAAASATLAAAEARLAHLMVARAKAS